MRSTQSMFAIDLVRNWLRLPFREMAPLVLTLVAGVACVASAVYWSGRIYAQNPQISSIGATTREIKAMGRGEGAKLFGAPSAEAPALRVTVLGVVRGAGRDAAIVAVSDGPARLVRVGRAVSTGWVLSELKGRAIVLKRGAEQMEVPMLPTSVAPILKLTDETTGPAPRVTNVPRSSAS